MNKFYNKKIKSLTPIQNHLELVIAVTMSQYTKENEISGESTHKQSRIPKIPSTEDVNCRRVLEKYYKKKEEE